MKAKTTMLIFLLGALGSSGIVSYRAFGDDKKHGEPGEGHHEKGGKLEIPDTVEGIFKAIDHYHHELGETVESEELADVHHLAFAIRDLANSLVPKAPADKKVQVEQATKNISTLATALDESGDAGNQAATESALKKMDKMLELLGAQFGLKKHH